MCHIGKYFVFYLYLKSHKMCLELFAELVTGVVFVESYFPFII